MTTVIDVKGLSKSFDRHRVVNNVDLRVEAGDVFGFLGPNGSGKTTTLRMLCGLLLPDAGSGTCLGFDLIKEANKIKSHVGYMTQRFSLYEDLTVRENLSFFGRIFKVPQYQQKVEQVLDRLGLSQKYHNQLTGTLSGGWKQRVALACVTIHEPQLLLLDEPTAGVDPKARRDFWEEIHALAAKGITALVSTHYMDEAERCNKLAYIAYGNILVEGRVNEVIEKAELQTFAVSATSLESLMTLEQKLKAYNYLELANFGQTLHVSANKEIDLGEILKKWQTTEYQWQKIRPSLEDVFIYFMRQQSKTVEGKT